MPCEAAASPGGGGCGGGRRGECGRRPGALLHGCQVSSVGVGAVETFHRVLVTVVVAVVVAVVTVVVALPV